jgi:hypothetical protein
MPFSAPTVALKSSTIARIASMSEPVHFSQ